MQITQDRLQSIIFEEYLKEEGIIQELTDEQRDEMVAWIKGLGPRPKWANKDLGTSGRGKAVQSPVDPNVDRAAATMPIPRDDDPESEYSGFQVHSGPEDEPSPETASAPNPIKSTIDGIYALVSDMEPEDVQEIFQIVFEKLPGVELSSPGDEDYPEEKPPTEYVRGADGRPKISTFGLDELKSLILKVMTEGHYHDMGPEDEMYDVLDPHDVAKMSDAQLVDMAHKDGMEEIIIFDGEGGLINREEVVVALKNV
jgi:hypothetical protein